MLTRSGACDVTKKGKRLQHSVRFVERRSAINRNESVFLSAGKMNIRTRRPEGHATGRTSPATVESLPYFFAPTGVAPTPQAYHGTPNHLAHGVAVAIIDTNANP